MGGWGNKGEQGGEDTEQVVVKMACNDERMHGQDVRKDVHIGSYLRNSLELCTNVSCTRIICPYINKALLQATQEHGQITGRVHMLGMCLLWDRV